jgi:bacillithiol disulfide reductase
MPALCVGPDLRAISEQMPSAGYPTTMSDRYELIVVGAGPCGIAVGAAAERAGLSCVLFDKGCVTSSLVNYPYYMTFFSTAVMLEVGDVPFTIPDSKPTRREALAYYRRVVEQWGLDVRQYEEVVEIDGAEGDFTVTTRRTDGTGSTLSTAAVVVATGGFQEPNFLAVPGEHLDKVHHYYREPYPYYDQDVVVVGAGNSAVESALEMYRNGSRVTLVHFLDRIDRGVKPWVVPDITNRLEREDIPVYWRHRVAEVTQESVVLRSEDDGSETAIANDFVVAMTGWRSDHSQLETLDVRIDGETGIPEHEAATMQTNVPGLYIAGVIAAGHNANKIFIENGREHGSLIAADRLAKAEDRSAKAADRLSKA